MTNAFAKLEQVARDLSGAVDWTQLRETARTQILDPLQEGARARATDLRDRLSDPATRPAAARETLLYAAAAAAVIAGLRFLRRTR